MKTNVGSYPFTHIFIFNKALFWGHKGWSWCWWTHCSRTTRSSWTSWTVTQSVRRMCAHLIYWNLQSSEHTLQKGATFTHCLFPLQLFNVTNGNFNFTEIRGAPGPMVRITNLLKIMSIKMVQTKKCLTVKRHRLLIRTKGTWWLYYVCMYLSRPFTLRGKKIRFRGINIKTIKGVHTLLQLQ